jgi:hypothetical protein
MRRTVGLGILLLLLTSCERAGSEGPIAVGCPPLYPYTAEEQEKAAVELEAMEPGIVRDVLMPDYAKVRAAIRRCLDEG